MQGKGIFTWKNGQVFEGSYQNDQKHGPGRLRLEDGSVIEATWVDGKPHGKGIYYTK
jgi:hypothetical protein